MIDPKIEKSAILTANPITNRIIIAGIDANAHFIKKETIDPKGISKSIIFIDWISFDF